ncbi:unnamed protein product [Vitrella brassicaformis CCMP3155]|uniref:Uncharacterized protein n=4 Tax=Vitrella brassicaformis TaxID=1169539 RepID=A0A0G4EYD4_VITBC|nr:unnamed protein product [Vitrella brassicaformis CCMP3155]|eukprot:CEM04150.1 unnamed protein product [Vitrella brassicaformis CCMP3155]
MQAPKEDIPSEPTEHREEAVAPPQEGTGGHEIAGVSEKPQEKEKPSETETGPPDAKSPPAAAASGSETPPKEPAPVLTPEQETPPDVNNTEYDESGEGELSFVSLDERFNRLQDRPTPGQSEHADTPAAAVGNGASSSTPPEAHEGSPPSHAAGEEEQVVSGSATADLAWFDRLTETEFTQSDDIFMPDPAAPEQKVVSPKMCNASPAKVIFIQKAFWQLAFEDAQWCIEHRSSNSQSEEGKERFTETQGGQPPDGTPQSEPSTKNTTAVADTSSNQPPGGVSQQGERPADTQPSPEPEESSGGGDSVASDSVAASPGEMDSPAGTVATPDGATEQQVESTGDDDSESDQDEESEKDFVSFTDVSSKSRNDGGDVMTFHIEAALLWYEKVPRLETQWPSSYSEGLHLLAHLLGEDKKSARAALMKQIASGSDTLSFEAFSMLHPDHIHSTLAALDHMDHCSLDVPKLVGGGGIDITDIGADACNTDDQSPADRVCVLMGESGPDLTQEQLEERLRTGSLAGATAELSGVCLTRDEIAEGLSECVVPVKLGSSDSAHYMIRRDGAGRWGSKQCPFPKTWIWKRYARPEEYADMQDEEIEVLIHRPYADYKHIKPTRVLRVLNELVAQAGGSGGKGEHDIKVQIHPTPYQLTHLSRAAKGRQPGASPFEHREGEIAAEQAQPLKHEGDALAQHEPQEIPQEKAEATHEEEAATGMPPEQETGADLVDHAPTDEGVQGGTAETSGPEDISAPAQGQPSSEDMKAAAVDISPEQPPSGVSQQGETQPSPGPEEDSDDSKDELISFLSVSSSQSPFPQHHRIIRARTRHQEHAGTNTTRRRWQRTRRRQPPGVGDGDRGVRLLITVSDANKADILRSIFARRSPEEVQRILSRAANHDATVASTEAFQKLSEAISQGAVHMFGKRRGAMETHPSEDLSMDVDIIEAVLEGRTVGTEEGRLVAQIIQNTPAAKLLAALVGLPLAMRNVNMDLTDRSVYNEGTGSRQSPPTSTEDTLDQETFMCFTLRLLSGVSGLPAHDTRLHELATQLTIGGGLVRWEEVFERELYGNGGGFSPVWGYGSYATT